MRIDAYGPVAFGSPGLAAPDSWLVLDMLGNGAKATGAIRAHARLRIVRFIMFLSLCGLNVPRRFPLPSG